MVTHDGYEWVMEMCLDSNQKIHRETFPNKTAAVDWLRENHPGFFRHGVWRGEGATWFQYGTDYYWASFGLEPKPSATLVPEVDKSRPDH